MKEVLQVVLLWAGLMIGVPLLALMGVLIIGKLSGLI
jgi:hypothetical protein